MQGPISLKSKARTATVRGRAPTMHRQEFMDVHEVNPGGVVFRLGCDNDSVPNALQLESSSYSQS